MTKVLHLNNSAYERCSSCGGHGHYFDDLKGEPDWCRECGSSGVVRARDKQGRFLGTVDPRPRSRAFRHSPEMGRTGPAIAVRGRHAETRKGGATLMARTVKEWRGKTDDSAPPKLCKLRIIAKQNGKCAITGREFTPKEKPDFDHIVPLWLGGENRESNLQAIHRDPHKRKTAAEAAVRGKVNANTAKHLGIVKPAQPIRSAPFSISPKTAKRQANAALRQPLAPRQLFAKEVT